MACRLYQEPIQELVDGTLGSIRRSELRIHLDQCGDCRALLADLERIRDLAATLDRPAPPDRVWLQVVGQLRQEGRLQPPAAPPVRSGPRYGWLALAAALVLTIGGSLIYLLPTFHRAGTVPEIARNAPAPAAGNAVAGGSVQGDIEAEFRQAEQHYQAAISKLEEAAKSDQNSIDPATAAMLQKNLQVIDQAIAESRAAFRSEPTSAPARDSLFEALKRKVSLLQDTLALMNEMRKGNVEATAQLVNGVDKG